MRHTTGTIEPHTSRSRLVTGFLTALGLFFALSFAPGQAHAQGDSEAKKQATEFYKQGTTQFKLGNFDDAIALFKKAYETHPHHAFLFNLGQAYRQKGDCKQAIFFYKGYLAEAGAKAKNRPVVEEHIEELKEICKATEDNKDKEPTGALPPEGDDDDGGDGDGDGDGDRVATADTDGGTVNRRPPGDSGSVTDSLTQPWKPSLLAATVTAGPALLSMGEMVSVGGAQPSVGIGAAYPLSLGDKLSLNIGGVFTYTPVPWVNGATEGTSTIMSALLNIGVRYFVIDKLSIGADVGGGGLFLGGLSDGNVFLPPGSSASGALTMPNVRVALALEYLLTNNLMISAAPFAFSMSSPKEGLRDEIESFNRIEFLVGMGYRM